MREKNRRSSTNLFEDMPPKRKRLYTWFFIWVFVLQPLVRSLLRAADLPEPVVTLLVLGTVAAIFIPLSRTAWLELQQRKAEGLEPEPRPVTKASLIGWIAATTVLWAGSVVYVAITKAPIIPVFPIAVTVVALFQLRRWHVQPRTN